MKTDKRNLVRVKDVPITDAFFHNRYMPKIANLKFRI
jgi:hypothetical protein